MTKLERLEQDVRALDRGELDAFRAWFAKFDAAEWDRKLDADAAGGRLDRLGAAALDDHRKGRTRAL